eukprot:3436889-Prymnesium_polylepis.1
MQCDQAGRNSSSDASGDTAGHCSARPVGAGDWQGVAHHPVRRTRHEGERREVAGAPLVRRVDTHRGAVAEATGGTTASSLLLTPPTCSTLVPRWHPTPA